jgi:uncharacterized membrane protein YdbT with pleckstrin-like domain
MAATDTEKTQKLDFAGQHEGEEVLFVFRQHALVMRRALIIGMLIILAALMPPLAWPLASWAWNPLWISLVLVLAFWFHRWVGWYYSVYIVTDQRLVVVRQKGFFNRKVSEYRFDKIQNINYHIRGLQAVLFGYGDIVAQTYVGDVTMHNIHKPVEIHTKLLAALHKVNSSTPPGL